MEIAQRESEKYELQALITGESLGQVASQTIGALGVTDAVAHMPVFRPLIGMDKEEIIKISRQIGAFENLYFALRGLLHRLYPPPPQTRPSLKAVEEAQNAFDFEPLIQRAMDGITLTMLHP